MTTIALVVIAMMDAGRAQTLDPQLCSATLAAARSSLDRGQYKEAAAQFQRLTRQCTGREETQLTAPGHHPYSFYAALALQLEAADVAVSPENRAVLLRQAIALYNAALAETPDDPTTHHNIGLAFADLNLATSALDSFERALRLSSEKNAWHMASFGRFLITIDRTDDAVQYLTRAQTLDPTLYEAAIGMVEAALARGHREVALQEVRRHLKTPTAGTVRLALELLSHPVWTPEDKRTLMATAAEAATVTVDDREGFDGFAEQLERATRDSAVGVGANEMLSLLKNPSAGVSARWWRTNDAGTGGVALWPAFRRLILATGDTASKRLDFPVAEKCFLGVLDLDRPQFGVDAVHRLAGVYASAGEIDPLLALATRYEVVFNEPRSNVSMKDIRAGYTYHRGFTTIGDVLLRRTLVDPDAKTAERERLAYFVLNEFSRANDFSAFALGESQHARVGIVVPLEDRLRLDAAAYLAQSRAYATLNDEVGAAVARIRAAAQFVHDNRFGAASAALEAVDCSVLPRIPDKDRERYETVARAVAQNSPPER